MTARVAIICGPADSGKTQRLLERCRAVTQTGSVGAALWLGPSRRSIEALRPRLLAGGPAGFAPHLLTFQDFAEEVIRVNDPAARPLSHVQRRLLADDLVAELHLRGELPHFNNIIDTRGFAETVFALLAELKQNEIWPEHLDEAIGWRSSARAGAEDGRHKDRQCALIYREYQRRLVRHDLYDLEGRLWYARDLLEHGHGRPFAAVRAVFVDGFTAFTRTQQEILTALCRWVEEFWIALPDEAGTERAELFSGPRRTLASFDSLRPTVEQRQRGAALPAGLAHLERELFRPRKAVRRSADAAGLLLLEAPGLVGEARMAARQIRLLFQAGARAGDVLIVLRDVLPYADLLREVFAEYAIPVDVEGAEPLTRNPAVATLLRVVRLPEEDWPFAAVTALLRSNYFRPDWPETRLFPEIATSAEALLRLLGEPRDRTAYLNAVRRWAETLPPGLEDEQAEESRRRRIHELARFCRSFLEGFFHRWDGAPLRATLADHVTWLRSLADDLGISRAAAEDARDTAALERLWDELAQWARLDALLHGGSHTVERAAFHRTLGALAAEAGLARTPRGPGRVRILSAGLARALEAPYVFVMGLGERSFPRLVAPEPLFDEQERQALRQAGLDISCVGDMMPGEMLLFYEVVTAARGQLVLSYPAVDEKGQALLPSSFLAALLDCFEPKTVRRECRRMLIERYDQDVPLSAAEQRVQAALGVGSTPAPALSPVLQAAREVAQQRFLAREHTLYDGLLQNPAVVAEVRQMFGPECILSPTALESYIACPFRFFLGHVLRLKPLEEPSEEIESTDRGVAFHRALSRLHKHLRARGVHHPTEEVAEHLAQRLEEAVRECATHASPAAEVLWHLEGQRLQRLGARYRAHWQKFVEPWLPRAVHPEPTFFEVGFGLPPEGEADVASPLIIKLDGLEVRISGRIDRVDVAPLPDGTVGFWIIDYKTGRASHYTGNDLKEYRRLQLTLYALAVEEVLLADQPARPLGLAYWLVADSGPKVALPAYPRHLTWLEETAAWQRIRGELQRWVVTLVQGIRAGQFPLAPRSEDCTQTCDFSQVCRISQSRAAVAAKAWGLPLPMVQ